MPRNRKRNSELQMLENGTPKIALPADTKSVALDLSDQLTLLIAFGPVKEYIKQAGITAETDEDDQDS